MTRELVITEVLLESAKTDIIETFCFEPDEAAEIEKIFSVPDSSYDEVYFFKDKDGTYHTTIERETIATKDFEEMKKFLLEFTDDQPVS